MSTLDDAIRNATADVARERAAVAPVDPAVMAAAMRTADEALAKARQAEIDRSWEEAVLAAKGKAPKPDQAADGWDEAVRTVNAENKFKRS